MSLKDRTVGVMMGGLSSERDVSLKSGSAVLEALKFAGLRAISLEVVDETYEGIKSLVESNGVNVVFVAMHGGFGEDGRLQGILERLGIAFTGPAERASSLAMDKIISRKLFQKAGLNIPKYRHFQKGSDSSLFPFIVKDLSYPLVVKPSDQGSSIGISFIDSDLLLNPALSEAFKYSNVAIAEEFILGREITVSVFDKKALPIVEIIPKKRFFDFQAKYEKGLTDYIVPAELDERVVHQAQSDAITAYETLGCRHLSRVDMIVDRSGRVYCLEVNTVPGMTTTSLFPKAAAAAGMDFPGLCTRLLELACEA